MCYRSILFVFLSLFSFYSTFSSKYAELQHRLTESISLERLALERAEKQYQQDAIRIELMEIDDKILEITNSIRQRKRPSENVVSLCKQTSPINHHHHHHHHLLLHDHNHTNGNEAWRKGRRQSTLRIYDELARLVDERVELEKQFTDIIVARP
jgi:ABC-type nickel/cobalt efflux system permease component RcnA